MAQEAGFQTSPGRELNMVQMTLRSISPVHDLDRHLTQTTLTLTLTLALTLIVTCEMYALQYG